MIIFGASGHGKVVLSSCSEDVSFFFDDNEQLKIFKGLEVAPYSADKSSESKVVVAVGNNKIRKKIVRKVKHAFCTVVDKSSLVDSSVVVGEGSQLLHGCILQSDASIGKHVIVNSGASVDHDCTINDYCHVAPGAVLCGSVSLGEGTMIGAGATIIPGVKIGEWCTIGAGAVVIEDLPDNCIAVGNPARIIRK